MCDPLVSVTMSRDLDARLTSRFYLLINGCLILRYLMLDYPVNRFHIFFFEDFTFHEEVFNPGIHDACLTFSGLFVQHLFNLLFKMIHRSADVL